MYQPLFVPGKSCARRRARLLTSVCACSLLTPSFRRPMTITRRAPRLAR